VAGIIENYVYGYLYLPNEVYERAFGEPCEYTTLLCKANDPDQQTRDAISTALLSSPNALSAQFSTTVIETFSDMLQSIDYIVVVLIISAGALAFVVLYNLTNINITERQKELATIKVLGFFAPEVNAYVYRETLILSLIGTAAGLFGGIFLHAFVVRTAEVDAVMFGRTIKTMSFVWSAVMTMIFTALVSLAMSVKLRRIDMVESLKAPE
jgi:putative ABC transport system permease protein